MQSLNKPKIPIFSQEEEIHSLDIIEKNEEASSEDADTQSNKEDPEENGLAVEETDRVVWDSPEKGSSGSEEKDITD